MGDELILHSSGLLSKWGFYDGDVPDELSDYFADHDVICEDWHSVLVRLVRERLLPVLDQRVEVGEVGGIHNPIRASRVDGVSVEQFHYGDHSTERPTLTPEQIAIPYADVVAMVEAVALGAP